EHSEVAAGAIRAIVKAQKTLKANPSISTEVGQRLFPADEAQLIAGLIERDAPFYDADISHDAVNGLMNFAKGHGLINSAVPYEALVGVEFSHLWKESMPSETGHRRRSSFPRAYLSTTSISRTPAARLVEALSCQLLTHARQQTASYLITRPLYRPAAKRDGVRHTASAFPESDKRAKIRAVRCLSKSPG